VRYSASGEMDALDYFYIDPYTGLVTVKKLLYPGSTKTDYTV